MGLYSKYNFIFVANFMVLLSLVHGKIHYHDFLLEDKNFTKLCSTKSAMVVNGSIPGPIIYVNKGDTLYVNVHNLRDSKVTIHWHGVKQPRNSWYDGPEYITQCAIKPGTNFTYEVIFSDEEGTLWWHAHNEWTRNTVHGAIVIHPEKGTTFPFPKPDGEQVLRTTIESWKWIWMRIPDRVIFGLGLYRYLRVGRGLRRRWLHASPCPRMSGRSKAPRWITTVESWIWIWMRIPDGVIPGPGLYPHLRDARGQMRRWVHVGSGPMIYGWSKASRWMSERVPDRVIF